MKTWVRRSLKVGALTAGALLASGTAAQADTDMTTSNNIGLGNGAQVKLPVQVPLNVCGNAVAVVGSSGAHCMGGAAAINPEWGFDHFQSAGPTESLSTSDNIGLLNGLQVYAPIQAPVNVCGNAVSVIGAAVAGCEGGASAGPELPDPGNGYPGNGNGSGDDNGYGPRDSESVWGLVEQNGNGNGNGMDGAGMHSADNVGALNGVQVHAPIQVPIDVCGTAVSVLGKAVAGCEGGAIAR